MCAVRIKMSYFLTDNTPIYVKLDALKLLELADSLGLPDMDDTKKMCKTYFSRVTTFYRFFNFTFPNEPVSSSVYLGFINDLVVKIIRRIVGYDALKISILKERPFFPKMEIFIEPELKYKVAKAFVYISRLGKDNPDRYLLNDIYTNIFRTGNFRAVGDRRFYVVLVDDLLASPYTDIVTRKGDLVFNYTRYNACIKLRDDFSIFKKLFAYYEDNMCEIEREI